MIEKPLLSFQRGIAWIHEDFAISRVSIEALSSYRMMKLFRFLINRKSIEKRSVIIDNAMWTSIHYFSSLLRLTIVIAARSTWRRWKNLSQVNRLGAYKAQTSMIMTSIFFADICWLNLMSYPSHVSLEVSTAIKMPLNSRQQISL